MHGATVRIITKYFNQQLQKCLNCYKHSTSEVSSGEIFHLKKAQKENICVGVA
jgi:hypothetical protein